MKREFLRGLGVEEDAIQKIIDEHHEGLQSYKEKAEKVDSLKEQLETANEEIKTRDNQIEELKNNVGDNDELKQELEKYKEQNANYDQKLKDVQLNKAIEVSLAKEKAIKPEQVIKLIDKDNLEVDDNGNVKGLDDYMNEFKKENEHLFEQSKPSGRTPDDGKNVNGGVTQEEFNNMSVAERTNLFVNDRKTYDALINN
ncbi:phage scaffolding protein [Staphylococcus epidermidis]|uniref:phage scaffolding protein n=1 Tax=Staphylococcus epidermidis TaxID=1282 RepID=UPI0026E34004|nr:phage scaffolding protein [Staphylococcus epidermidis]MCG2516171.1 phage scaffolding protein [Staphylococcus epidermidis]MDO6366636.1 phage scaffolding protein [Staphylococcus epidermidis]MDO6373067.1 phage scaffolding protein [Staphylococcus epidermidis]